MKTFVVENNVKGKLPEFWYHLPDSVITNPGKPFYIPEFAPHIEAHLTLVLKVNRLGKSIAQRFAERYFSEVAVGVHFRASELRKQLIDKGLPADKSWAFDRSLILSDFYPKDSCLSDSPISLLKNGVIEKEILPDFSNDAIGAVFQAVSNANTLKIGDLLLPHLSEGIIVDINDVLEIKKAGQTLLRIEIK